MYLHCRGSHKSWSKYFSKDEQDGAVGEEGEEAQEEAEIEVEGRDRENRGSILPLLIHQSRLVEEYDNWGLAQEGQVAHGTEVALLTASLTRSQNVRN